MTHQAYQRHVAGSAGAGQQVAQLRHALKLVERIAGDDEFYADGEAALDENARFTSAYDQSSPIVRRRFDALAAEASAWAATGIEALLTADKRGHAPHAAARRLANELSSTLRRLGHILGV
jgi:hypothetical protein